MNDAEPVEEHRSHHKRTMIGLFIIVLMIVGVGFAGTKLAWPDWVSTSLAVVGLVGFIGFILIRMNVSRCPTCRGKASHLKSIQLNKSPWEVFECKVCGKQYRIPGVSADS